ncbi:hypothetical protein DL96DRAFT_1702722 [Flagelloscypha sp. PMI_526]|nr:hypothetical protein DL96DRAFT_1702722 [Flagelloscypha sp. PMI_526]
MSSPLAHFSLFIANRAQKNESRTRICAAWGYGMTPEQYLARDERMEKLEQAKDGNLITWILAPRDNPETLDFPCSCETYKRAFLAKPSHGVVENTTAYGIGSVFTAVEHRGKGYATHMMHLLHWALAGNTLSKKAAISYPLDLWGEPPNVPSEGDGVVSVLFSDIGSEFYRVAGPTPSVVSPPPLLDEWTLVQDPLTLDGIWDREADRIRHYFSSLSVDAIPAMSFLTDEGVARFQYARLVPEIFSIHPRAPPDPNWGLISSTTSPGEEETFATWDIELKDPAKLVVTRFRCPSNNHQKFESLVYKLLDLAREYGFDEVEIWNLAPDLQGVLNGKTIWRHDHLACMAVYRPDLKDAEWLFNEK